MKSIRILDCTLRDGGFTNDWQFGLGTSKSIVSRLAAAGVEVIELGFIDERRAYDPDRTIVPDSDALKPLLRDLHTGGSMLVAMIDYGTCALSRITPRAQACIEGIRVIFKKADQDAALAYMRGLMDLGYKVFCQPVSTTGYSADEILRLIEKINAIRPYSVAVVDTYGLMHRKELIRYFSLYDDHLAPGITLGYHSHNNFQLAYANSIELTRYETNRDLLIDSSLYGMGKGAGNANTELIAMYLKENFGRRYQIDQLLEAIEVDVLKEFAKHPWGYSLLYYVAALNNCHPDYVKNLLDRRTLSVHSINEVLGLLPAGDKLTFRKARIEAAYHQFQAQACADGESYRRLQEELACRPVLLLGPGGSLVREAGRIQEHIARERPVTIAINFMREDLPINYVFMGNAKRYSQFFNRIYGSPGQVKVICTSNITEANQRIDFRFNYSGLAFPEEPIRDNPLLLLLRILAGSGVREVTLAGFDGYTLDDAANYYPEYVPYLFCGTDPTPRNTLIANRLRELGATLRIHSLTASAYL
jgi:4-hydroxy 2-oxovalerate aldolase